MCYCGHYYYLWHYQTPGLFQAKTYLVGKCQQSNWACPWLRFPSLTFRMLKGSPYSSSLPSLYFCLPQTPVPVFATWNQVCMCVCVCVCPHQILGFTLPSRVPTFPLKPHCYLVTFKSREESSFVGAEVCSVDFCLLARDALIWWGS